VNKTKSRPHGHHPVPMPCNAIDDLYQPSAQRAIGRLLDDWLRHECLTVMEFTHSAAALQRFESVGTAYQHAVQRMAVTWAGRSKAPVVEIVRALTALTAAAMQRVYADDRGGMFPQLDADGLVRYADGRGGDPAVRYALGGILAKYLAPAATWDAKLQSVIDLRDRAGDGGAAVLVEVTESLAAEIVDDTTIFVELLGPERDFGDQLSVASRVSKGIATGDGVAEGLKALARHFAKDEFSEARAAVTRFVLEGCKSARRLRPQSLSEELDAFRALTRELRLMHRCGLRADDISVALAQRSTRFVSHQALTLFTAAARTADDKLDRLLALEKDIEGAANKRAVAQVAVAVLNGRDPDAEFAAGIPGVQRLRRAAELQRRVQRSGFQDADREKMVGLLDAIAVRIESEGRFIAGLRTRLPASCERVDMYLKLFGAGVFTEGLLAIKARRAVLAALADPGFVTGYMEDKTESRSAALKELVARLKAIGISPEESVRAMSAM
jgi:negative regulator of replication initiation